MPSISSVRRTGRWASSTRRMISSFSEAGYLMRALPPPRPCFFEQPVLEGEVRHGLLERGRLGPQVPDLRARRLSRFVARQALLTGLQELLRPTVIEALRDAFAPAELRDAVLAAQAGEHDGDLLLRRVPLPGSTADVLHRLLGGRSGQRVSGSSPLLDGYDEPETLRCSITQNCPKSADAGQAPACRSGRAMPQAPVPGPRHSRARRRRSPGLTRIAVPEARLSPSRRLATFTVSPRAV
jgi:hypothetical protein